MISFLFCAGHVEENEKDNIIENGIDDSEIKFYNDDHIHQHEEESGELKQIHQVEDTQGEHDEEEHSVPINPANLFTGSDY